MIGQVIVANTLPILGLLLVNITQPQIAPLATFNSPQASSSAVKQEIVWIVKENETLSGIASTYYGNSDYWTILASDNPWIKDPNTLNAGWKLKLRSLPLILNDQDKAEEKKLETAALGNYIAKAIEPVVQPTTADNISPAPTQPTTTSGYDDVYKEAGAKFGVPWQILYGIHLTETGLRDGTIYNGAGSGARGPMQFMPGTFQAYAVDGEGDGKPNIDDAKDAIYTAANYLAQHGSVYNGLVSYGGNISGILSAARSRGYQM